jgi:predicted nucleotidyltransferase
LITKRQDLLQFLNEVSHWAAGQPDILAVALVGSYARDEATRASDVDLVMIAWEPATFLQDTRWAQSFGTISRRRIESYGKVTSLRIWYSGSYEVEFGFTDETWSALPLDEGTKKVISDGLQIVFERGPILSR